jgi:hypothetical protein
MFYTLTIFVIGVFVGWNLPQPPWAKDLQDRVVGVIRSLIGKINR